MEAHAAAQLFTGLAEGERFAKGCEAVAEVGEGFGGEVIAEIGCEKTAIDLALLQVAVDVEGLFFGGGWRKFANHRNCEARDGGSSADGVLICKDRDRQAVVDKHFVVGNKTGDFAAVLDRAMAAAVEDFDAQAVVGTFAVFELNFGKHLFVALGLEKRLG